MFEKYNKILINIINNKMENLEIYNKRICNIFNKCSEKVQIDFIKLLFSLNKEPLNDLQISNINTIKELLNWGVINNNIALIHYILNNKDVKLDNDFYYSLEKLAKNKKLVDFLNIYRIKDVYKDDNSSDSDNYDSNSNSSSIFSSDLDRSDEEEEYNYNPEDFVEVD
jgi:hypothetical protein